MASPGHPTVQWVKKTGEKVDLVAFHPILPWVAYARRDNVVAIWDYLADQDIYVTRFGSTDQAASLEGALKLDASAVVGPERSAPSAIVHGKSSAAGTVKGIGFVDVDVCFWQLARHNLHNADALSARAVPTIAPAKHKLLTDRWLLVVCEGKVVLHSIQSASSLEVSRALLDGKAISCATPVLMHNSGLLPSGAGSHKQASFHPLLAVGTSAGIIFIVEPVSGTIQAVLTGGHKSAVTTLQVLPSTEARGADRLVSGSADGTVAVWEPSTSTYTPGARREISPRHSFKAHDAAIRDMTLVHVFKGEDIVLRLATTGDDRKVALWMVDSWTSVVNSQPLAKTSFHSVMYCPWAGAGLGGYPSLMLASGETPLVLGMDPDTSVTNVATDVSSWLDPGMKKVVKTYSASAHPQKPDLFALATNTGVAILGFPASVTPPVLALPHQILSLDTMANMPEQAEEKTNKARAAQAFTCLAAASQSLWVSHLKLESVPSSEGPSGEKGVRLLQSAREALIKLEHAGPVSLGCSPTGRSISVLWPEQGKYCVYSLTLAGAWEMVDSGAATSLVWSTLQPQYAILRIPQAAPKAPKQKRGLFSAFGRKKPSTPEAAEQEAPVPGSYVGATVQVHSVDETRAVQWVVSQGITMDGTPVAMHGGALLGIVLEGRPAAEGEANLRDGIQFFSWTNFTMVGAALPTPKWVSWEPDCTAVALAYDESVELCRTTPRFEQYATLSLAESTAAIWQSRQLYVVTPDRVFAVFTDPAQAFVQVITLASVEGMALAQTLPSAEASPLPHQAPRPAGPLVILGIRHSYLWLADSLSRPYLVSLRHAGVRLRSLAARSELSTARTIAERGLGGVFHDDVARYLVAMGGHEGVVEALKLSGLSPALETQLAILVEDWDRAAAAFQAMALGIKDRNLLQLVRDVGGQLLDSHASHAVESKDAGFDPVAGILEEESKRREGALPEFDVPEAKQKHRKARTPVSDDEAGSDDEAEEEEDDDDAEEVEPTAIDWDAELDRPVLDPFEDNVSGAAPALVTSSIAVPDGPELDGLMAQGLDLADAAIHANHLDAARIVLGVFVRMAAGLPRAFLGELVLRLGQCSMTESARSLARAAAKGVSTNLAAPSVAAPLAALIGGRNSQAVVATLTESELAPLAAIFAGVWGTEQREAACLAWQRQLDADEPHGSARFVVTPPVI